MTARAGRAVAHARSAASLAGYRAGWAVVEALPEGVAERAFDSGADLAWRRNGKGVRRLRSNLRRVVGPTMSEEGLDDLVRLGLRSYARYWREVFRPQTYEHDRLMRDTVTEGWDFLAGLVEEGRGVILALPHCGNWDAAGAWITRMGVPITAVAERLEPEALFEEFVAFRERIGIEIIPHSGHERQPMEVLRERLGQGRVVCLVAERDLGRSGIPVEFFGATAKMPAGPAALAIDTGAALVPVDLWFTPRGWGLRVSRVVAVPPEGTRSEKIHVMTQDVARSFEAEIRRNPEDWHMLQRIWLDDLDPGRAPRDEPPGPDSPDASRDAGASAPDTGPGG